MTLLTEHAYTIVWGNNTTAIIPPYIHSHQPPSLDAVEQLKNKHQLHNMVLLNQTHQTQSVHITDSTQVPPLFSAQGDFITTNQPLIGIGVLTADCLPIIIYDPIHNALGIAHASWKTSVQKITLAILQQMHEQYGTDVDQVQVWFGPSAKPCCYEIQKDFLDHLYPFDCIERVVHTQDHKMYFNLPTFNRLLLQRHGVDAANINTSYNTCTICNEEFCSVRRVKNSSQRQITLAWLQ